MIRDLFTVRDNVAEHCGVIFVASNPQEAVRIVKDTCLRPSPLTDHPEDFELLNIGTFDEAVGCLAGSDVISFGTVKEILDLKDSSVPVEDMIGKEDDLTE